VIAPSGGYTNSNSGANKLHGIMSLKAKHFVIMLGDGGYLCRLNLNRILVIALSPVRVDYS
jgi:hypothetical protein